MTKIGNAAELIETLKANPMVLGVLQYGAGRHPESADIDLCVVVSERPRGIESFHFWIGSGPVDLNVRTLEELRAGTVVPEFDDVLRAGRVLYEREPGMLDGPFSTSTQKPLPDANAVARIRHGHAHYLHKLQHYEDHDPLLCQAILCGAVHWLLRSYCVVRGIAYGGERLALQAMRARDGAMLADLEILLRGSSASDGMEALRRLTAAVLAPVGGAWQPGEVLCFAPEGEEVVSEEERESSFQSLVGPAARDCA